MSSKRPGIPGLLKSKRFLTGLLILLGAVGFTVAGYQNQGPRQEAHRVDSTFTGIPGAPPMPDWLTTAHPLVKGEYLWAASHVKELQYIPCYCGCGHSGHTNNLECYYDLDSNGRIVAYDSMSAG